MFCRQNTWCHYCAIVKRPFTLCSQRSRVVFRAVIKEPTVVLRADVKGSGAVLHAVINGFDNALPLSVLYLVLS